MSPRYAVLNIPCTHLFATCDTEEEARAFIGTDTGLFMYELSPAESAALAAEGAAEGVLTA